MERKGKMSISWTNHRPPSMTDIFHLDEDISLVDPGPQFGAVCETLNIEPNPFTPKDPQVDGEEPEPESQ